MHTDCAQALKAKLTQMPPAEPEKAGDDDMENLMSALGQESEKVDKLIELLQERGFDPADILTEVQRLTTSLSALWLHLRLYMGESQGRRAGLLNFP